MPKRRLKKVPRRPQTTGSADRLGEALAKRTKAELVDVIVELARTDSGILRRLESRFGVEASPDELVAATGVAIRQVPPPRPDVRPCLVHGRKSRPCGQRPGVATWARADVGPNDSRLVAIRRGLPAAPRPAVGPCRVHWRKLRRVATGSGVATWAT